MLHRQEKYTYKKIKDSCYWPTIKSNFCLILINVSCFFAFLTDRPNNDISCPLFHSCFSSIVLSDSVSISTSQDTRRSVLQGDSFFSESAPDQVLPDLHGKPTFARGLVGSAA